MRSKIVRLSALRNVCLDILSKKKRMVSASDFNDLRDEFLDVDANVSLQFPELPRFCNVYGYYKFKRNGGRFYGSKAIRQMIFDIETFIKVLESLEQTDSGESYLLRRIQRAS